MAGNRKKRRSPNTVGRIIFAASVTGALLITDVFLVSVKKIHPRSGTDLSAYADSANTVTETITAERGRIYDSSSQIIAEDVKTYNIICYLDSSHADAEGNGYVKDKKKTAQVLSGILDMSYDDILSYLNQDVYQTELGDAGRNLSEDVKDQIVDAGLDGIDFENSITRVYPKGQFASNLIGYVGRNDDGTYSGKLGLEQVLDSYLTGKDGSRTYQTDASGYILPGMKEEVVSATNGNDVYLTLNSDIQDQLEASFEITAANFNTTKIWGAVMEADTGRIVAWGQYPGFDPNTLNITDYTDYGRDAAYEPGSTMKTFTWAAAINEGKYNSEDHADGTQYCYVADSNNNPVHVASGGDGCIFNYDHESYPNATLDDGLKYSLNSIAATIENDYITPEIYENYLEKFGFFQAVNTDGLSESSGLLNFNTAVEKLDLSFGQGSTVTMLQLLQAYSAVMTDGTCKKPYFIDSIRDSYDESKVLYQGSTQVVSSPITAEAAKKTRDVLWKVANEKGGTLYTYRIPECEMVGKTGTAEVAINGSYDNNVVISSYVAGLPASQPKYIVYYAYQHTIAKNYLHPEAEIALFRKVAQVYKLSDDGSGETSETQQDTSETAETAAPTAETTVSTMPSLLNHTVTYAGNKLSALGTNNVVLGSGSTVIDQYPKAGSQVESGQRVFLLTDTQSFTMPDLTGWTRKDVASLWAVTGFGFELEGDGKVVSQSAAAGTVVTRGTEIHVVFASS